MKDVFLFLLLVAFSTGCNKSDTTSDTSPLDMLFKIQMNNGDVIYASPVDNNAPGGVEWGHWGTDIIKVPNLSTIAAANMDFAGQANTDAIVAQLGANNGRTYAAKVCADLVAYGFDDWYLPAAGELNELYLYLMGNGWKGITTGVYWSSSEVHALNGWSLYFNDGRQPSYSKPNPFKCRCVRR